MKLDRIASELGCTIDSRYWSLEITRLADPADADESSIVFLNKPQYQSEVMECRARVVIAPSGVSLGDKIVLAVADPYLGFAKVGRLFEDGAPLFDPAECAERIFVHPTASLHSTVAVGPFSVIGKRCEVGKGTVIGAGCVIENGTVIGEGCRIDSGAVIRRNCRIGNRVIIQSGAVVGSEGFGNARDAQGRWERIPSFGAVDIGDDAEIGANCTIDRGALRDTVIGSGVKLDNLVHIAHNVVIGQDTVMAAQAGVSGSTTFGNRVIVGGQAGFVGHIHIADDSFVGAQAGVSKGTQSGEKITGYPARDLMTMRRIEAAQGELPALLKEVKRMNKRIEELEKGAAPA